MRKNALVVLGILTSLVSAGGVFGKNISAVSNSAVIKQEKITVEQARKIALKKVEGTVEDEYTIEDEDENVTTYVFVIKNNKGKSFEVQVDANNGNILSSDEINEDTDEGEEPPTMAAETSSMDQNQAIEAPMITEYDSTVVFDENYSNYTPSNPINNQDDSDVDPTIKAEYKLTLEQARVNALEDSKGEIQSENLITNDDAAYYTFIIKSKKGITTEVRVDANSGKTKQFKEPKSE